MRKKRSWRQINRWRTCPAVATSAASCAARQSVVAPAAAERLTLAASVLALVVANTRALLATGHQCDLPFDTLNNF